MRTRTTWDDLLHPGDAASFFDRAPRPAFDPAVTGYTPANAWWLAELSRLVYRHDVGEVDPLVPSRREFLGRVGLHERGFWNDAGTATQALLVEADGAPAFAVLAFRGTEQNVKDFVRDLSTFPQRIESSDVRVHSGFLEGIDAVWKEISASLDRLTCRVFYTGHSLGAALATLAAWRRPPKACYTFGSPRVGNEAFAKELAGGPIYRVVDDGDAVTRVPPEGLGFRHVGELHRIVEPTRTRALAEALLRLRDPAKFLADHAPINYVDRIP